MSLRDGPPEPEAAAGASSEAAPAWAAPPEDDSVPGEPTTDQEVHPGGIPSPDAAGPAGAAAPAPAAVTAEGEATAEADNGGAEAPPTGEPAASGTLPGETLQAIRERDEYLDSLRRLQADFENYKKRMVKQQSEYLDRAEETLVAKLLPVLDTADLALAHGAGEEVKQVSSALTETLQREGLQRIDPQGAPFDPNLHDAVAHEPTAAEDEGQDEGQVVAEVLRAGYRWRGRMLRPAMVKVRG